MKKTVSMLLSAAMVLVMLGLMTACGDADKNGESSQESTSQVAGDTSSTSDSASVFPAALENVQAYPVPDVANTGWELTGGMVSGKEMEETDLKAVLDACGGKFQFIFNDAENVQMVNGEKVFNGTYGSTGENYALHAVFEGYEYYGVFTQVNNETVLILANKTAPETALYFTQIDER